MIGNPRKSRLGRLTTRDSPELLLSEVFALVLGAAPALAADLANEFTSLSERPIGDGDGFAIQTELPFGGRAGHTQGASPDAKGRIDVAIESQGPVPAALWIEVKWGMKGESSPGQVMKYARELDASRPRDERLGVLYLTDLGASSPDMSDRPGRVVYDKLTWRDLNEEFLKKDIHAENPVVSDFSRYLREVGLAMDPVEGSDIEALEQFEGARDRMRSLLDIAFGEVEKFAKAAGVGVNAPGPTFRTWAANWGGHNHASSPLPERFAPLDDSILLEWNLRRRSIASGVEGDDAVIFAAGLTWYGNEDEPWLPCNDAVEALQKQDFYRYYDGFHRLYRWKDPVKFTGGGGSLTEQGHELGAFVVGAYEAAMKSLES